jgi:hypothetical protein
MLPPLFISTVSKYSIGRELFRYTSLGAFSSSGTWYGANYAVYHPLQIPWPYPMKRLWLYNGGTPNGNFDLGIFSADGAKLISTGSFVQAGSNQMQFANAAFLIPPGRYYLGISNSSGSGQIFITSNFSNDQGKLAGILKETPAFPLPAVMTPATWDQTPIVLCGITRTESWF